MTKAFLFSLLGLFFLVNLEAADGDTTLVSAHQQTDLTWYRSYKDWAVFPASSSNWQEITLKYTMGCATGGCSDWDYTTLVNLLLPTGNYDSNVARIDTISVTPLVIDTTWNVFEVKERMELCKVITPYGGSLSNDWTRTFYFDISDYYPLLHDSIEVEVFYQGWSSGFSASLEFIMIEGAPIRPVYSIQNLYRGQFNYLNPTQFETNHMPARKLNIDAQAQYFELKMAPSGHGFVNALNCAEFCEKDYYVYVDGQLQAQQSMWRDDCGLNDLWPQAGTWLYDRANWCPGDRVNIHSHNLDLQGKDSIDIDIESYNYTVPSGQTPAGYNMSATLFQMGDYNRKTDLALHEIMSPSEEDEYARLNPVCSKAVISIRNEGSDTITNARIAYGLKGNQNWQHFDWTGTLLPLEVREIELPMDSLSNWVSTTANMEFVAQIERVNGSPGDEWSANNRRTSKVKVADRLPPVIRFELRTNNAANETFWRLEDASGTILHSGDNLSNSVTYRDTFNLNPGCYMLLIGDRGKDGLSFFANNDGSGRVILRNVGGDFFYESVNPNFGTEFRKYFTVGYGLSLQKEAVDPLQCSVYPNPTAGNLHIQFEQLIEGAVELELMDLQGRVVLAKTFELKDEDELQLSLASFAKGLYQLQLKNKTSYFREKVILK